MFLDNKIASELSMKKSRHNSQVSLRRQVFHPGEAGGGTVNFATVQDVT